MWSKLDLRQRWTVAVFATVWGAAVMFVIARGVF